MPKEVMVQLGDNLGRDCTKEVFVLLCTCILYAYVNGCTDRSHFLSRSTSKRRSRPTIVLLYRLAGRLSIDRRPYMSDVLGQETPLMILKNMLTNCLHGAYGAYGVTQMEKNTPEKRDR